MMKRLLSLKTVGQKFLVPTMFLLIVLLGLLGTSLIVRTRTTAEKMMAARAEAMASFMEQVGKGFVVTYNLRELDVMTREAMKDPEIVFAAFYDDQGKLMTVNALGADHQESELIRYVREFKDGDGRPIGSLKLFYTTRTLQRNMREGFVFVIVGVAVTLVLFGVGVTLVTRRILRPIHELTHAAQAVVQKGDLRQNLSVSSEDEIGQLAAAFAAMVVKLRDALGNLQTTSQRLDSSVVELTTSNDEQSKTLSRQAAALSRGDLPARTCLTRACSAPSCSIMYANESASLTVSRSG